MLPSGGFRMESVTGASRMQPRKTGGGKSPYEFSGPRASNNAAEKQIRIRIHESDVENAPTRRGKIEKKNMNPLCIAVIIVICELSVTLARICLVTLVTTLALS